RCALRGVRLRRARRAAKRHPRRLPAADARRHAGGRHPVDRGCTEPVEPARHQERRRRRDQRGRGREPGGGRRGDRRPRWGYSAAGDTAAGPGAAPRRRGPPTAMSGTLLTLFDATRQAAYTSAGYWGEETLYQLAARRARETPDAFAVRDRYRR